MDAIVQLQTLDATLDTADLVTMTTVFQDDINASDTYLALAKPGMQPEIHRAWLRKTIDRLCPFEPQQFSGGQNDFLNRVQGTNESQGDPFMGYDHGSLFVPGPSTAQY